MKTHFVLLTVLTLCLGAGSNNATVLAATAKPNILFLFADDQSYETIHALGNPEIETPNLDRLVRSGTAFTHAYNMGAWHGAVCVASRTSINTGRSVWRCRDLEPTLNEEVAQGRFWAQYLQQAGYETYFTGKWHIQADATKVFQHTKHIRPGMPKDTPKGYLRPVPGKPDVWQPWDKQFGGFWEGGTHWSEVLAADAEAYLAQAARQPDPFFMYLAFNAPHDPRQSPKEFVDRYPAARLQVPQNFLPEYPYMEDIGCGKTLRDERLAPWPRTPEAVQLHRQEYYALITHLDVQIGKILNALQATGKADNTYIFFTADHGLAVGHHGLMGKQNMYEHSMRPPLIVVGPGVPKNQRIQTPVYLQDIMPTSLEIAGVEVPKQVEFRSLLPLIRGERSEQYDAIYGAYREDRQRMVLKDGKKLINYPKINRYRLYDLQTDPQEQTDLIGEPRFNQTVAELKQELRKLQVRMKDPLMGE